MQVPTEEYLLKHRKFVFWDEWLTYAVWGALYYFEQWVLFGITVAYGLVCIGEGYQYYWKLLRRRFGP